MSEQKYLQKHFVSEFKGNWSNLIGRNFIIQQDDDLQHTANTTEDFGIGGKLKGFIDRTFEHVQYFTSWGWDWRKKTTKTNNNWKMMSQYATKKCHLLRSNNFAHQPLSGLTPRVPCHKLFVCVLSQNVQCAILKPTLRNPVHWQLFVKVLTRDGSYCALAINPLLHRGHVLWPQLPL